MASVEEGRTYGDADLFLAARVTGIAATVVGAVEVLSWAANLSMTEAVLAVLGNDGFFGILHTLWVLKVAATAVVAAGVIVGWRQAPLLWAPGVGSVVLGLVLNWGWWAADRYLDVWGMQRFVGVEPTDPAYLMLLETLRAQEWVDIAIAVAAIALLVSGGMRLLIRRRSAS